MRKEVLIELIDKWNKDSERPETLCGDASAQLQNAEESGRLKATRKCAQDLSTLISLLG